MEKILLIRKKTENIQIRSYVTAVQAGKKMYHLAPNEGKWVVKKALEVKASKIFDNKVAAKIYAVKLARNDKTELVIHGKDGRVQDRRSYGDCPSPTKG